MFTITIKLENLTKQEEEFLEKKFTYLERTEGKSREQLFEEAFIEYMLEMEWKSEELEREKEIKKKIRKWKKDKINKNPNLTPRELKREEEKEEEIERNKKGWEIFDREPHNYHIKEALLDYLEELEEEYVKEKLSKPKG